MRIVILILCCVAAASCGRLLSRSGSDAPADLAFVQTVGETGHVCGESLLWGEVLAPIEGRGSCGIEAPVRVLRVGDVDLVGGATLNCEAARAFALWAYTEAMPRFEDRGGLTGMRVAASYVCRTRNHRRGARLSEHSFGNAIDISEFHTGNGAVLTVLDDWRRGRTLQAMHEGACGIFGTVLGPQSDRMHRDHFHFDIAQHRNGPYCR